MTYRFIKMALKVGLEISLRKRREGVYSIELRYSEPDSEADIRLGARQETDIHIDLGQLQFQIFDTDAYASLLTRSFFADEAVRAMFARARSIAERLNRPLSVRLLIDEDAPELNCVFWELLRDPTDGTPLFLGENIHFSRYLSSTTWRKVKLHSKAKLRALAVIANPEDLDNYRGMVPIPVDAEIERARQALGEIPLTVLGKAGERASLKNLINHLQDEKPDILYIVCHGAIITGQPYLWLENAEGKTAVTSGKEWVTQIQELTSLPLLVVLASCQSAGDLNEPEFRTALGPRLAQAGIPAIVAMQGNISQATEAEFMPVFFESLQKNGEVDQAMSLARGRVRERYDFWMPVLFSRLKSGVIFAEEEISAPAARFGWRNWIIFSATMLSLTILTMLFLSLSTGRQLRATLPVLRCQWPLPLENNKKVAVAEFQMPQDMKDRATLRTIQNSINKNLANLATSQGSILYCPVSGEPADFADRIGALILVYGEVTFSEGEWFVQPSFYIHPDMSGANELTGEAVFGQKIPLGNDPARLTSSLVLDDILAPRIDLLGTFLEGIVLLNDQRYPSAEEKFIQTLDDWANLEKTDKSIEGKDIVYLWLGNAIYEANQDAGEITCPPFLAGPPLDEAVVDYADPGYVCAWKAYEAGENLPNFTRRLLLAKGNWWLGLPPIIISGIPQKYEDYTIAIDYYQEALEASYQQQPEPLTSIKAGLNIGIANLMAGDEYPGVSSANWFQQSLESLTEALDQANQIPINPEINSYRAQLFYNRGRASGKLLEHQQAINDYTQALEITGIEGKFGESPWKYRVRWGSLVQRGIQYMELAKKGDPSTWSLALEDFKKVISAWEEEPSPTERNYVGDAYIQAALVYEALGDQQKAADYNIRGEALIPTQTPTP